MQAILYLFKSCMKKTRMPLVHAANLVANSDNTLYGVCVIIDSQKHWGKLKGKSRQSFCNCTFWYYTFGLLQERHNSSALGTELRLSCSNPLVYYSWPWTWPQQGFPQPTLSVKACLPVTKACLTFAFVTEQPFGIPNWNLGICIFVAWTISIFHHTVVSVIFGCTAAIRCGNACHGPHSDILYSGSEHSQFNSPRLVKREAGFPNPRRALIGSNQLWSVNDSPYYWEIWLPMDNNFHVFLSLSCWL